ncbi:MAG: hypothetical protein RBS36_04140 [Thiomicrospira sp.]|jgi:hypothetical protein|nr:hypothetical protein [Thiomicrospira sp.]
MADLIKIKRSATTATPPTLAPGELAYSEQSGLLFYGRISDGAPIAIGGKALKDKLDNLSASDLSDFAAAVEAVIENAVLSDLADVDITGLSDGQVLVWDAANTKWQAAAIPGGGATTFLGLNDTPAAYTGAAGFFVRVNAAGNGLEYVEGIDGGAF